MTTKFGTAVLVSALITMFGIVSTPVQATTYDLNFSSSSCSQGGYTSSCAADFNAITLFNGDMLSVVFLDAPSPDVPTLDAVATFYTTKLFGTGKDVVIHDDFLGYSGLMTEHAHDFSLFEATNCCFGGGSGTSEDWTISFSLLSGEPSSSAGLTVDSVYAEVENVPLPAALPLFATGLGVLALFGWSRERKAHAVASQR
jgi:hypothetical protein